MSNLAKVVRNDTSALVSIRGISPNPTGFGLLTLFINPGETVDLEFRYQTEFTQECENLDIAIAGGLTVVESYTSETLDSLASRQPMIIKVASVVLTAPAMALPPFTGLDMNAHKVYMMYFWGRQEGDPQLYNIYYNGDNNPANYLEGPPFGDPFTHVSYPTSLLTGMHTHISIGRDLTNNKPTAFYFEQSTVWNNAASNVTQIQVVSVSNPFPAGTRAFLGRFNL